MIKRKHVIFCLLLTDWFGLGVCAINESTEINFKFRDKWVNT